MIPMKHVLPLPIPDPTALTWSRKRLYFQYHMYD
jgi:hypothetical protein